MKFTLEQDLAIEIWRIQAFYAGMRTALEDNCFDRNHTLYVSDNLTLDEAISQIDKNERKSIRRTKKLVEITGEI